MYSDGYISGLVCAVARLNLDSVSIAPYPCGSLSLLPSSAEMPYTLDLGHSRFVQETETEPPESVL